MIKAFVVDDEQYNLDNIAALLRKYSPDIELIGTERSSVAAIERIRSEKPDLLFLDIQMPYKTGFDLLQEIGHRDYTIIFITAYDQYGIQALRVSAVDYLLKPIDIPRFKDAVALAVERIEEKKKNFNLENLISIIQNKQNREHHRIAIATLKETFFIFVKDIVYCESDNSYTHIYLHNNEKILSSQSIQHYQEVLDSYGFVRTHQSYLVNKIYVRSLVRKDGNYLQMQNNIQIPVSRYKLDMVKKTIV